MYLRKTNFILLYLLLIALPLFSQSEKAVIYNESNGLTSSITSHAAQCNQGYIWTLNDGVINRFDGKKFWQHPSPPDSLSGSKEKIMGLCVYQDSLLFLHTIHYFFLLNPTTQTWKSFPLQKDGIMYSMINFHQQSSNDIIFHCTKENEEGDKDWSYIEFWRFQNQQIQPIKLLDDMIYCDAVHRDERAGIINDRLLNDNSFNQPAQFKIRVSYPWCAIDSLDNKYLIYLDTIYSWKQGEVKPTKASMDPCGIRFRCKEFFTQFDFNNELIIHSLGMFFKLNDTKDSLLQHPFNRQFKTQRTTRFVLMDKNGNLGTHDSDGKFFQYEQKHNQIRYQFSVYYSYVPEYFYYRKSKLGFLDNTNIAWFPEFNGLLKVRPNTSHFSEYFIKETDTDLTQDPQISKAKRSWSYTDFSWNKGNLLLRDGTSKYPKPIFYPKFGEFTEDNQGNVYCVFEDNIVWLDREKKDSSYQIFQNVDRGIDIISTDKGILMSSGRLLDLETGTLKDITNAHPKIDPNNDKIDFLYKTKGIERWKRDADPKPKDIIDTLADVKTYKKYFTDLLLKDDDNQIWRANDSTLYFLDQSNEEWIWKTVIDTLITTDKDLFEGYLDTIFEEMIQVFYLGETSKKFWMGFRSGKLISYSPKTKQLERYELIDEQLYLIITAIHEDSQGKLWVATTNGLYHFDPVEKSHVRFGKKDGLLENYIVGILPEGDSSLWLKTMFTTARFDIKNKNFRNYSEKYSVQNSPYPNPFHQYYYLKDYSQFRASNGEYFFSSSTGITSFYPKEIIRDYKNLNRDARFVLSSFEGLDIKGNKIEKQYNLTNHSTIHLEREGKYLTFEYGLADYNSPEETLYSYQLEGFDDTWTSPSSFNGARYVNLPPGKYIFRAKAYTKRQISHPNQLAINIVVHPPWWKTNLAYFIYFLLLSGLAYVIFSFVKRRLELQAQLKLEQQEAVRLKELDNFKSKLYTNLTHEFRTPLTVILGMVQQIRNEPKKYFDEGTRMIETNGRNLLRLINQLLDLSKLEDRSFQLKLQQSDIIPYIKYISESFHTFVNSKNLSSQFFTMEESLIMDYDPEQIKQVMTNLISNAVKFTPSGGEVIVRITKENEQIKIEVKDTGIGISEKEIPHIFDRFYQVDGSMTREGEGTGIGLAHTQELVKLMGGKVSVNSMLEKGSTFTIYLPIRNQAPFERAILKKDAINKINLDLKDLPNLDAPIAEKNDLPQLLIIEDNHDVVVYLKSCLENFYQIDVAYNGQIGIEKALESIPDLIISDVMMPEKDGFEVCDTLKNDERTSHIPLVLLTAKADSTSKIAGLKRGADAYLSKPFDKEELLVRLELLVERQKKMATYFSKNNFAKEALPVDVEIQEAIQVEDVFIKKVKKIIEENYADENFALPQLCQKIRMSRSQLFRKMKALINTSPSDFIRTYRLEKAKALLETTEMNVSEVSWEVGFKDVSHFSKSFQNAFGHLPSQESKNNFK